MQEQFKEHIETNFPELKSKRFLLACSGGLDSVVLAHLCYENKMDFALAHCNFKLRGKESDADADFVENLAHKFGISFFVTQFNTMSYVNKNKVSVQMAARELRYAWFNDIRNKNNIPILVTAHHADDDLETFLINLSRGTGIDGLTGIPSKTEAIVRPLLKFSREQILEYATTKNLEWREDMSNSETKYVRNKIRHEIVPHLKELHPTFLENLKATQSHLLDVSEILASHIKALKIKIFNQKDEMIRISISQLEKLNPLNAYLYELLNEYGFGRMCTDIATLLKGMSGKELRSHTHRLVKDRDYLLLEKRSDDNHSEFQIKWDDKKIDTPIALTIQEVNTLEDTGKNILYVDKAALRYPLIVRKWQKGDYFYPFGMKGKKKLSKYFKDEKIDVISKERQWLLCSGEDIIWVIGRRADNRFRVTKNTKESIKFVVDL